jgi:hypothetical protein
VTSNDEIYSDCLMAMKNGAVLLHPLDAEDDKCFYLKFDSGYKEDVSYAVAKRLIAHPNIKKDSKGNWAVWKYQFNEDFVFPT